MKNLLISLLILFNVIQAHSQDIQKGTHSRWSERKANEWYDNQPWPVGFNYVPANAISYTEMWMPYCFDDELIARELALAEGIGFNCLRVVLPFVVWEHDPDAFTARLDEFLDVCDRHGMKVMFTLFDDLQKDREIWFGHMGNNSLRQGKWKAVISSDIDGRWQLYNMEEDRTELNNLADNFYNRFGDPIWKQMHQERISSMKKRWEELNEIYQQQGKEGLNEDK